MANVPSVRILEGRIKDGSDVMTRQLVIDADGHVEEDLSAIVGSLPSGMRDLAPQLLGADRGRVTYRIEGRVWGSKFPFPGGLQNHVAAGGQRREGGRDPRARLAVLDDEEIDAAVLYPSVGLMFGLYENPSVAAALCRAYNDWLASYCAQDRRRLVGVALLPQQDPQLAADELERAVSAHGFVGGVIRPNRVAGRTVDDADYDPLWAMAAELNVPIAFHEAYLSGIDTIGQDRMHSYAANHVSSHIFEGMGAMLVTTLAGLQSRFPGLRLGFFECGCGWAPTWVDRIEEHYEMAPEDFRGGDPHGVVNKQTWLTFELDEPGLEAALGTGWQDNVCFASDYPHFDAFFPGAVKHVRERLTDDGLQRRVLGDNALGFYGARLRELVGEVP
jgi:predicted TIM-barrel fold metal-dependent hydrolase